MEIATNISSALQIYRNAVSGTAYSVQEGRDIAAIFPGINKSQGLNQAILSGRMKAFDITIDSQYRNTLGSTYDSLKTASRGGLTDVDETITAHKNDYPTREALIDAIFAAAPHLSKDEIAKRVYSLIPDKK